MKINRHDYIEFSKIYKRVMDIELCLKESLKFALTATFPNKMFFRLIPFLKANFKNRYIDGYKKNARDKLIDLINSTKTEEDKINEFINMAYLSDLLKILTEYPALYKDKKFVKNFYRQNIVFNDLKKYSAALKKLRNAIMHFDIITYKQNRMNYIIALGYWEKLLNCTYSFIHMLPPVEPKISAVLKLLSQYDPNFFQLSDRIVCDLFDEVAFLNGKQVKDFPEYWSIVRRFYDLRRKVNPRTINSQQTP